MGLALLAVLLLLVFVSRGLSEPEIAGPVDEKPQKSLNPDSEAALLSLSSGIPKSRAFPSDEKDPWLDHREFGIVIDAGSSGSRVYVYSWLSPAASSILKKNLLPQSLPIIDKGDKLGEKWMLKEQPGISSFANTPEKIPVHLDPLLKFAENTIPKARHSTTPVYLFATAGMRLVPEEARNKVLLEACRHVKENYEFQIFGSCQRHFRVISGELEGIFGWLAVNYMLNGFSSSRKHSFGFLDMGGASTQIAFEPTTAMAQLHKDDLSVINLRTLGGENKHYEIFVSTFLEYGVNEARRRHLELLISQKDYVQYIPRNRTSKEEDGEEDGIRLLDPCLPEKLVLEQTVRVPSTKETTEKVQILGTGAFDKCMELQHPLLNKTRPCHEDPCLFNGVHAPIIDFFKHSFVGVSEYWYTITEFLNEQSALTYEKLHGSSRQLCMKEWSEIERMFEEKKFPAARRVDDLQLKCFKSAWLLNVLYNGIGIPKTELAEDAAKDPLFQIIDDYKGFPVSWTMGAILLHISESTPQKEARPLLPEKTGHVDSVSVSTAFFIFGVLASFVLFLCYKRATSRKPRRYVSVSSWEDFEDPEAISVQIPLQDYSRQQFAKRR